MDKKEKLLRLKAKIKENINPDLKKSLERKIKALEGGKPVLK